MYKYCCNVFSNSPVARCNLKLSPVFFFSSLLRPWPPSLKLFVRDLSWFCVNGVKTNHIFSADTAGPPGKVVSWWSLVLKFSPKLIIYIIQICTYYSIGAWCTSNSFKNLSPGPHDVSRCCFPVKWYVSSVFNFDAEAYLTILDLPHSCGYHHMDQVVYPLIKICYQVERCSIRE